MRRRKRLHRRRIDGPLEERFDVAVRLDRLYLEDDAFEGCALHLGNGLRALDVLLDSVRVQLKALAGHGTACATRTLLARRTRRPRLLQTRDARLCIVLCLAHAARVHHVADLGDRNRGLRDVGRHDNFSLVAADRLKDTPLLAGREVRMERKNHSAVNVLRGNRVHRTPNLAHTRAKDEDRRTAVQRSGIVDLFRAAHSQ